MTTALVVASIAAAVTAAAGTAFVRGRAALWGLIDRPNERSLHSEPTPRGGGVMLVVAALGALTVLAAAGHLPISIPTIAYALGGLMIASIGWRDDFSSVRPSVRLLVHVVAAVAMTAAWGGFDRVALPGGVWSLPFLASAAVTTVWIVGLVNAYNFMDGIDGLAAGQALVGGIVWAVAAGSDAPITTAAGTVLAAASAGFLFHNWSPARIFMGDAGSGFLGFSFASLPLMAYYERGDPRALVAGAMIVAPFLLDTAFTLLRRLVHRENVVRAHRSHLYQRLVIAGWTHRAVASLYLAIALCSGAATVIWLRGAPPSVLMPVVVVLLFLPLVVGSIEQRRGSQRR